MWKRLVVALALTLTGVADASAQSGGGWTRDGWSDAAGSMASSPASAGAPFALPDSAPLATAAMSGDPQPTDTAPDDRIARRRTWDGGRGTAFRYDRGERLPAEFAKPDYVVSDWGGYGLAPPPAGAKWVRYFDDAVLIDGNGGVIDAAPDIGWAQPARPYGEIDPRDVHLVEDRQPQRIVRDGKSHTYSPESGVTVTRGPDGKTTVTTVTLSEVTTTTTEENAGP